MEKVNIVPRKTSQRRLNFLKGFVGTNRSGKTTVALDIAERWRESRPSDPIIAFDPQDRFGHISNFLIDIEDSEWAYKCSEFKNGLIILDDYKMLNRGSKSDNGLDSLLYMRCKNNMDIIYICHSPSLILNIFTYLTTHYYIFHTLATDGSFAKKIPNYHLCVAALTKVNEYVHLNGRGMHPEDPEFNGQKFPYIIVDTQTQNLSAINMLNKPKVL